jgi:cytochrome c-type biogenesis protein CcmH
VTLAAFALFGLLAAATTPGPVEPPRGQPLSGELLDQRTDEVGALLRCPVCQGLSVADSPATMARNMKAEVRQKLAAGYDQEQILADFERSYGEFVRLEPPMRGVNWLVWFGPAGVLLVGGAVVAWALRRSPRPAGEKAASPLPRNSDLPSRDTLPADPRLAAAVRRVRMLAYGWPDGISPKEPS